jgi:excisionase family DNA binding protein
MAYVSIREAAEMTGKSVDTLYRKIRQGKLSASKNHDGDAQIDIAELVREFGALQQQPTTSIKHKPVADAEMQAMQLQLLQAKLDAAEAKLAMKDDMLAMKDQVISALERTVLLLEHKPHPQAPQSAEVITPDQPPAGSPRREMPDAIDLAPAQEQTKKQRKASLLGAKKKGKS